MYQAFLTNDQAPPLGKNDSEIDHEKWYRENFAKDFYPSNFASTSSPFVVTVPGTGLGSFGQIYATSLGNASALILSPNVSDGVYLQATSAATPQSGFYGSFVGSQKWIKGTVFNGGTEIMFVPSSVTQPLRFNIKTKALTLLPAVTSTTTIKYRAAVYVHLTNKIYAIPADADELLVIDPETNTFTEIPGFGTGLFKWRGGVYVPSQQSIYFIPSHDNRFVKFNVITETWSVIGTFGTTQINKFAEGVLSTTNTIVCVPGTINRRIEIDIATDTVIDYGIMPNVNSGVFNYWSGAPMRKGRVVLDPSSLEFFCANNSGAPNSRLYEINDTTDLKGVFAFSTGTIRGPAVSLRGVPWVFRSPTSNTVEIFQIGSDTTSQQTRIGYHLYLYPMLQRS